MTNGIPTSYMSERGTCSFCGVSGRRCSALRAGRCCPACLDHYGDTHPAPDAAEADPPTVALAAPADPPTDPPFYAAVAAEQRQRRAAGAPRPTPTPRDLEAIPDPPIYQALAAELLIDPLPRAYVRSGRG